MAHRMIVYAGARYPIKSHKEFEQIRSGEDHRVELALAEGLDVDWYLRMNSRMGSLDL